MMYLTGYKHCSEALCQCDSCQGVVWKFAPTERELDPFSEVKYTYLNHLRNEMLDKAFSSWATQEEEMILKALSQ